MRKYNLLIVDDEQEDLDLMENLLNKEDFSLLKASSGTEALEMLKKKNIQILILDILMPGMTGYDVCREVRKSYPETPLQIILVSGLTTDHFLEQVIEAGGDDFIYKPINPTELQRRTKLAQIRLKNQINLLNQKQQLEKKVDKKEKLSRKIIHENRNLLQENEDIRKENRELSGSNRELMKQASFDMLSGLFNRLNLFQKITTEIARAERTNLPLTGIMLDVDHFKRINDTYGHPVGDEVIKELGKKIKSCLRIYDYAGRYGGEEFYLVLPNASLEQGFTIGERLRKKIEAFTFKINGLKLKATVSMGIAQYRSGETREAWIERADRAMYRAKNEGRNNIARERPPYATQAK